MTGTPPPRARIDGLRLIGLFKIGKALLLLMTTYGIYRMLDIELVNRLYDWVYSLTDSFARRLVERALDWFNGLGHARVSGILIVTTLYTSVLFAEGIGLWFRKVWAEWLTVCASAALIPFEVLEFIHAHHGKRLAVALAFTLNVIIVIYLYRQLRLAHELRRAERGS